MGAANREVSGGNAWRSSMRRAGSGVLDAKPCVRRAEDEVLGAQHAVLRDCCWTAINGKLCADHYHDVESKNEETQCTTGLRIDQCMHDDRGCPGYGPEFIRDYLRCLPGMRRRRQIHRSRARKGQQLLQRTREAPGDDPHGQQKVWSWCGPDCARSSMY
jgi:hypothetical protein